MTSEYILEIKTKIHKRSPCKNRPAMIDKQPYNTMTTAETHHRKNTVKTLKPGRPEQTRVTKLCANTENTDTRILSEFWKSRKTFFNIHCMRTRTRRSTSWNQHQKGYPPIILHINQTTRKTPKGKRLPPDHFPYKVYVHNKRKKWVHTTRRQPRGKGK